MIIKIITKEINMKANNLKTSAEWMDQYFKDNLQIIDPDGWDRLNFSYSWYKEKISLEEFKSRVMFSTITWKGNIDELLNIKE